MKNKKLVLKFDFIARFGFLALVLILSSIAFSCSSVFSAGLSGKVVDAESTSNPKAGIQDVEVYVYTKEKARDADFDSWDGSSRFSPTTSKYYIGHTTTDSSGEFNISKIVWEAFFPEFGKTADYAEVFILFYHENFGLIKNSNVAMVMSDATANSVYQELTKIRTTTVVNLKVTNVATSNPITDTILATITVPQNGAASRVYEATITSGTAAIPVTYPRYVNGAENKPTISITLEQNGNDKKYKQCKDGKNGDWSFFTPGETFTMNELYGDSCDVKTSMKAFRIAVPGVSGTYGDTTNEANDGKTIEYYVGGSSIADSTLIKSTTTYATTYNNTDQQKHGNFNIDAEGFYWETGDYSGKTTSTKIFFKVGNGETMTEVSSSSKTSIKSDETGTINVTLN